MSLSNETNYAAQARNAVKQKPQPQPNTFVGAEIATDTYLAYLNRHKTIFT